MILGARGALAGRASPSSASPWRSACRWAWSPATAAACCPRLIMRVTDVVLAIPQLVLALALAQLMSPSLRKRDAGAVADLLAVLHAHRLRRGAAAVGSRCSSMRCAASAPAAARIVFLHILPNAASPIIVRATIGLGFTILIAAVLGFLGMGATPPAPDWGLTIAQSRIYLPSAWWYALYPGPRDPADGHGLQPAGRRVARPGRSRGCGGRDDPGPAASRGLKVSIRTDDGLAPRARRCRR